MVCAHQFAGVSVGIDGGDGAFTVDASRITFGRGCIGELGPRASALGLRRVALFTDRQVAALPLFARALASLRGAGLDVVVHDEVEIEPTDRSFLAAARFAAEIKPFTPLSCDNLPANGAVLRRLVLEFAAHRDASLAKRIEAEVPFPSTMVDRITPASTEATYADAARLIGREDRAAVETEPFWQWVIEDRFAAGRPVWGAAGATLVGDVGPYETMKLRMINGAHTLLVCLGVVAGLDHVRDVMAEAEAVLRERLGAAARAGV